MAYDHTTTTDEVMAGVDLGGKTAVVTGATAGLGIETSRVLAAAGAQVIMTGRNPDKLEAAVAGVRESAPDARLDTELFDLADLASIRKAAAAIAERHPRIDLLINNAGVMACPLGRTADGFEMQFGSNHLGHFLFTGLLAPCLLAAAPARVVNLSSAAHRFAGVNLEDPNYERRDYDKWESYGQSKSANALFSIALDKRLSGGGVRVFAVHPGMIITELGRHLDQADHDAINARAADSSASVGFKSIPAGAATTVWAATSADLDGKGGIYLEDCGVAVPVAEGVPGGYEPWIADPEAAEQLWTLSEQLVGQSFDFADAHPR